MIRVPDGSELCGARLPPLDGSQKWQPELRSQGQNATQAEVYQVPFIQRMPMPHYKPSLTTPSGSPHRRLATTTTAKNTSAPRSGVSRRCWQHCPRTVATAATACNSLGRFQTIVGPRVQFVCEKRRWHPGHPQRDFSAHRLSRRKTSGNIVREAPATMRLTYTNTQTDCPRSPTPPRLKA
jgi:hypothetical protein